MVDAAQDQGWEGSLHLVPSFSLSCAEITTHAITSTHRQKSSQTKQI